MPNKVPARQGEREREVLFLLHPVLGWFGVLSCTVVWAVPPSPCVTPLLSRVQNGLLFSRVQNGLSVVGRVTGTAWTDRHMCLTLVYTRRCYLIFQNALPREIRCAFFGEALHIDVLLHDAGELPPASASLSGKGPEREPMLVFFVVCGLHLWCRCYLFCLLFICRSGSFVRACT